MLRRRRHRGRKLFTILIFVLALWFGLYQLFNFIKEKIDSTPLISAVVSPTPVPTEPLPKSSPLEQAVKNELIGTKGSYGIVIKHFHTDEYYSMNPYRQYDSGSLYKLWVMAVVYKQIENGVLKKEDVLSEDVVELNKKFSIEEKFAEQKEGKITYSVEEALEKMITISDNYAALLLAAKIRLSNITSFLKTNGFSGSRVGAVGGAPVTTAFDIALFFEKLYTGKLANEAYTDEMIVLLKRQRLNGKIPRDLPVNTVVAHKTGELEQFFHDAGIVYAPDGEYIIVVLTESNSREQAEERIANVSQAVYNYFTGVKPLDRK